MYMYYKTSSTKYVPYVCTVAMLIHIIDVYAGVNSQFTVTIASSPAGTPVDGSTNIFDYPILSSVVLECNVASINRLLFNVTSYQWNTTGCYTHSNFNNGNPRCFPNGQTTKRVIGIDLTVEDAGAITCTATINGTAYVSGMFILRLSGE